MKALRFAWGLPVALMMFWIGTLARTEQPKNLTVEDWRRRVATRLDRALAENARLRKVCADLSNRTAACERAIQLTWKDHLALAGDIVKGFADWQRWGNAVERALAAARQPIIISPPHVTVTTDPLLQHQLRRINENLENLRLGI